MSLIFGEINITTARLIQKIGLYFFAHFWKRYAKGKKKRLGSICHQYAYISNAAVMWK